MSQSDTLRGVMLALVANFIWGIAALYWLQTKPVDAFDVMAHRGLWTLPVTLIIVLMFGRLAETLRLLRSWRFVCWVALSALMLTINWGVYVFAVTNERATEASLGYFMLPLLTIALGVFVFGERPKPVQLLAIGLAIVAVLLQLVALGSLPWVSLTLALSFSLYAAIRKQIAADSLQGLFLESLCMAPFAVVWLIVNDGAGLGMHGTRVDLFLLLGGAFTAAPLLTYVAATRVLALSTIGLLTYVGPTLQLIVAIFVLREPATLITAVTFGLVWLGVIAVSYDAWRFSRKRQ
ncbi:MAG: EamA family transporter RarD [Halieaceae bacterium]|nr:EamA family transporter RarD [Halieaceae bacterium]MBT5134444.1 EamA family transporter RarD [Halieaceae bacterium]MBT5556754.1 EamA family transporter RarD [Halieaceae bacterium]MBT6182165.1 EamA family transporter RarD [Halieaceae bacterium]MDG1800393.1 EamA family transporter RarD [Luminiphilus sp.]